MNRFYQPSGKISAWVFPYFLVCASGIVPMLAFGYTFLIHSFLFDKRNRLLFSDGRYSDGVHLPVFCGEKG